MQKKMCCLSGRILLILLAAAVFTGCKTYPLDEDGNLVPETVDEDPSLPSALIHGALLHTEAFGAVDSPLVVALHGGPGADYRYLLPFKDLADHGFRVVFYDQRGAGLSQRFNRDTYIREGREAVNHLVYDELKAVIDHYRVKPNQKVFLLGHSWGGMLATGFTGRYPNLVNGLVVMEPGGLTWADVETYIKESRSFKFFSETLNDVTALDQFLTAKDHELMDYKMGLTATRNDNTGPEYVAPFWRNGAVVFNALIDMGEKYKIDFSEGIGNYRQPVLFFYSELNKVYTDSWAQRISSAFPIKELTKVPGVGHDGIVTNANAWTTVTLPKLITYFKSR
ncbi:MAG: alpha/beta hydrolase [Terrimonas ferruginea]|uniref:alpha/beta fold hydrolase n=1 Tax=Terrimonas ferruginea TaxID=249 RepID=UPI000A7BDC82|nr:alpha/beta hydrolase [Terrimonas ferruginea]MBN8783232.1 alpha/beta hydrolase [Terrimonas ferruginea]